jgi:hypothetical protein
MSTLLPKSWWWLGMPLAALAYWVWSFTLTDPNLVFTSWAPYWQFQQWAWQLGRFAEWQAWWYVAIVGVWWFVTAQLWRASSASEPNTTPRSVPAWLSSVCLVATLLILVGSNNALSHDLFNYLFNAKMVMVYGHDPHVTTALNFAADPWVRFMHNTHTAAPYGYGWTAWSLIPYVLGFGKFTLTWLIFKGWMAISWLGMWASYIWLRKSTPSLVRQPATGWIALINPLVLIEVFSTGHNDLWMMLPALWALVLLVRAVSWARFLTAISFLIISFNVKLATLTLVPWAVLISSSEALWRWWKSEKGRQLPHQLWQRYWADLAALSVFIPLLTPRSQFFHPWYWIWCLVWYPYVSQRWLRGALLAFAISSTFRYWPWLAAGQQYSDTIVWHQQLVTWLPAIIIALWLALHSWRSSLRMR